MQAFRRGLAAPAPQHVGSILTLAHFLDHMYHHRPAKRVEASPWFEAATGLVQGLITEAVRDAPKVLCCAGSNYTLAVLFVIASELAA